MNPLQESDLHGKSGPVYHLPSGRQMRVVACIEDPDVILKILRRLNLWELKSSLQQAAGNVLAVSVQTPAKTRRP